MQIRLLLRPPSKHWYINHHQGAAHPWMAELDVKGMVFMVPLQEEDKRKLAFTWDGIQFTLNRPPQGYKHSPTIAQWN